MMDESVFRALALDSYNRGYRPGISGLSEAPHTSLGAATIVACDGEEPASDVGFYAIAYEWNGETIIAYRGTDEPLTEHDPVAAALGQRCHLRLIGLGSERFDYPPSLRGRLAVPVAARKPAIPY